MLLLLLEQVDFFAYTLFNIYSLILSNFNVVIYLYGLHVVVEQIIRAFF